MNKKKTHPYGEWPSPVTPALFANLLKLSEPCWLEDNTLVWRERTSGVSSLERFDPASGSIRTISGTLNIGGTLLYGGGGYTSQGKNLFGFDKITRQLFRISPVADKQEQLSADVVNGASPQISPDGKSVIFVHTDGENDAIYYQNIQEGRSPESLVEGSDFYNYPRWSPDGSSIAWISWAHPHLPWDSSQLWLGKLSWDAMDSPSLRSSYLVAGGEGISILQPEFTPDGKHLVYISDEDGWWQVYMYELYAGKRHQITKENADHGLPPWLQDQRSYRITPDSKKILFLRNKDGIRSLWKVDLEAGSESKIQLDQPYTWLEDPALSPDGRQISLIASGSQIPARVITADLNGSTRIIRDAAGMDLPREYFSVPEPISWNGMDGGTVHGLYYPPTHPEIKLEASPPLLVMIHSGPTRQKWIDFQPRTQYFTSRGFAVLEVNYRGSTGYGRAYWEKLKGKWGVLDVDDCFSGAMYCAENGLANGERMAVMGSSSGGLAVFQILTQYPGTFKGAISIYGIVNHLSLLKDPPKFERHYSDWLIGPYPESADLYRARSPIFTADKIQDPVAIFQGGKDRIVPPDQAEQIINILKKNAVPYLYRYYPDEGHSFKKKETLEDFYAQVEAFLREYVG